MYTERPTTNEKKKTESKKKLNFRQLRRLPVQQRTKKKKSSCLFTRSHEQAGGVSHRERQRGITAGCKKQ